MARPPEPACPPALEIYCPIAEWALQTYSTHPPLPYPLKRCLTHKGSRAGILSAICSFCCVPSNLRGQLNPSCETDIRDLRTTAQHSILSCWTRFECNAYWRSRRVATAELESSGRNYPHAIVAASQHKICVVTYLIGFSFVFSCINVLNRGL